MVIVSSFSLKFNEEKQYFSVSNPEIVNCPYDDGELIYRDSVFRNVKNLFSEIRRFLLRRLLCQICGKLHRELPDIIQPYKHYESDVIQAVIEDNEEAEKCSADDSTMRRWKSEFWEAKPILEQKLISVYARLSEETIPLEMTTTIIDMIKSKYNRWLPFVTNMLTNFGFKICTEFAFFPLENSAKVDSALKIYAERGRINVKTIKDTS